MKMRNVHTAATRESMMVSIDFFLFIAESILFTWNIIKNCYIKHQNNQQHSRMADENFRIKRCFQTLTKHETLFSVPFLALLIQSHKTWKMYTANRKWFKHQNPWWWESYRWEATANVAKLRIDTAKCWTLEDKCS